MTRSPASLIAKLPDHVKAGALMLAVAAFTAIDTALVRVVSSTVHPFEIGFFRGFFGLLCALPWVWPERHAMARSKNLPLHLGRAALKLLALVAFFTAIAGAPLTAVTAIAFTTPLFVALGASLLLRERLPPLRIVAIAIGFGGVLIIVRPGAGLAEPAILFAVAGAIGLAGIALLLKFLSGKEETGAIVGLNLVLTVPLAFVLALPFWTTPSLPVLGLLALQGAAGALSMTAVTRAMRLADASWLMPIEFVRLPLVAVIALVAFGERVDIWTLVGGLVILAAIALLGRTGRRTRVTVETRPDRD